jgi:hypothetical protein
MRQRVDAAASTPDAAMARAKHKDALQRAYADVRVRYPTITLENAPAALDYQAERIDYWRTMLGC